MNAPRLTFQVERRVSVPLEVIHNAAHAMGLVWTHYVESAPAHLRLVFTDRIRHPQTDKVFGWHALATPELGIVQFALCSIDGAFGPLSLAESIIPTAAHEMMHVVQYHRGEPLSRLLGEDGSVSEEYDHHPQEAEARQAGLHALKCMLPNVRGHFDLPRCGGREHIPAESLFRVSDPYRIYLERTMLIERLILAWRTLWTPGFPFRPHHEGICRPVGADAPLASGLPVVSGLPTLPAPAHHSPGVCPCERSASF